MIFQKQKVSNYFDEEQEEQEEKSQPLKLKYIRTIDFTGQQFNEWTIVSMVDQYHNIYKVFCSCGKEFVRNVYPIVKCQIYRCRFCQKRKGFFRNL